MVLTGSFEVKIRTNTAKFTNMIIARFRESRYLVRESEAFIKDKTKVTSRVSSNQWAGINFGKLLWEAQSCTILDPTHGSGWVGSRWSRDSTSETWDWVSNKTLFGLHFMSHLTAVHNFLFSMYMYAGDMTVDETLLASTSAWNCRNNGTIVLIARCTSCKCRPP